MRPLILTLVLLSATPTPERYTASFFSVAEHSFLVCKGPGGEEATIAWVAVGKRSLLFPQPGKNLTYAESVARAHSQGYEPHHDGTFAISRQLFEAAKAMRIKLASGLIMYKTLNFPCDANAMNCQKAIWQVAGRGIHVTLPDGSAANRNTIRNWGLTVHPNR